ncbi:MAG TPA: hypothetical protein VGE67_09460, partial [Haloferula sp.]
MKPADRACALALSLLCAGTSNTRAEIIAATHIDWTNSGHVSSTAQNTVAGFNYGYYPANTGTDGSFSTVGMFPVNNSSGQYWNGSDGGNTPAQSQFDIHPGLGGTTVVRRYTVASAGEPLVSGPVRVVGRFFELNNG